MNMINKMALSMQLDETTRGDDVDLLAWQRIVIDEVDIEPEHAVDLEALGRSLFEPGEHNVFTCGCGDAGCAYIYEGIHVIHEPGLIRWQMRRPVSFKGYAGEDFDAEFENWKLGAPYREYVFNREQMVRAYEGGMDWLRNETPPETNYSPYGFDRPDVERIDLQKGSQCLWWRYPGKKLYVLCDQDDWFMVEGTFVTALELGLSPEYADRIEVFRADQGTALHTDAKSRLNVLGNLQTLLLDAYKNGLSDELEICLVARLWGDNGSLDPWQLDSRRIQRDWLDTQTRLPWEYLIVSALENFMYVWFDETSEPKQGWPNRVNNGTQFLGSFRVPLALEREFILWASRVPDSEEIPDWAWRFHWQVKPESAATAKFSTWTEFHSQGVALAGRLAQLLSGRVTVMYERPQEDASEEAPRRYVVRLNNGENINDSGSGSSYELAG